MNTVSVQVMEKATLDGVLFRTMKGEAKTRSCNSCVGEEYKDADNRLQRRDNYGRVKAMFSHEFGGQTEIIFEMEWYSVVGTNPITGLTQITRNHDFDSVPFNFLKNLYPHNMVFWPSDLTQPDNG